MGHIWQQTRNVDYVELVHEGWRDVSNNSLRGRIWLFCEGRWVFMNDDDARYTKKEATCLLCIRMNALEA